MDTSTESDDYSESTSSSRDTKRRRTSSPNRAVATDRNAAASINTTSAADTSPAAATTTTTTSPRDPAPTVVTTDPAISHDSIAEAETKDNRPLCCELFLMEVEESVANVESSDGCSRGDEVEVDKVGTDDWEDDDVDDDADIQVPEPPVNEAIAALLTEIANDYGSYSKNGRNKRLAHLKAAGLVRTFETRITPLNAMKLGDKNDALHVQYIDKKIAPKIHEFVTTGFYSNCTTGYTFNPPTTAYEAYWNLCGPYTDYLMETISLDHVWVQELFRDDQGLNEWDNTSPLAHMESLSDNGPLLFMYNKCNGDLEEMLMVFIKMIDDLKTVIAAKSKFVCPPFRPKFQVNTLTTEPPKSSGASDSTADNKHSEQLGGSTADGSEDFAGSKH